MEKRIPRVKRNLVTARGSESAIWPDPKLLWRIELGIQNSFLLRERFQRPVYKTTRRRKLRDMDEFTAEDIVTRQPLGELDNLM